MSTVVAAQSSAATVYRLQIDPETRDIMQNEYLREVRKVGGQLANVELETLATQYKDPWKEFNKPK